MHKVNRKYIKDANIKSDLEIARGNVGSILQPIDTGKTFLNKTLITQKRNRSSIQQMGSHETKKLRKCERNQQAAQRIGENLPGIHPMEDYCPDYKKLKIKNPNMKKNKQPI